MPKPTYKNMESIPTWKLREIINSFNFTGIDGSDYGPVKEEIETIYWKRLNDESIRQQKHWEKEFKDYFKHQNSIKKKVRV